MSDLQLITGLAIVISGLAQLRCGISAYHWQRLIYLAWFACITHLCCLSFLREHMRQNKVSQLWRLPVMVSLVIMLIYALATTSRYEWSHDGSTPGILPGDPAICHLNVSISFDITSAQTAGIQRVVISMIFLAFSMVNRIQSLYRAPTTVVLMARRWASHKTRNILARCYRRCSSSSKTACMEAILVYRPLLALFLTIRLSVDVFTSKALDVRDFTHPHSLEFI
jgi:hypothetical protein